MRRDFRDEVTESGVNNVFLICHFDLEFEPYEHHNQAQDCYRCDYPWLRSGATSSRLALTLAAREFDGFFDQRRNTRREMPKPIGTNDVERFLGLQQRQPK